MDTASSSTIASFGSLDPEVAADIALLREFMANRQRHLVTLFGRLVRHSPLRDELLRIIIIAFGAGRHHRVAFYVRACASYGAEPTIRSEIDGFVSAKLVVLVRDGLHSRALLVQPTKKLIHFYNEQMPRLRSEVTKLMSEDYDLSQSFPRA